MKAVAALALVWAAAAPGRAAAPGPSGALSDPEIVAVLDAANQGELDAARLAERQAKNRDVKDFARKMLSDHGGAKSKLQGLVSKLEIEPQDTEFSSDLKRHGRDEESKLSDASGDEFDRAYIDAQVGDHAALLSALDTSLIPGAKNQELAAMLKSIRGVVSSHLQAARRIQSALTSVK